METLRTARLILFSSFILLLSIGIVMVYSASAMYAFEQFGDSLFFLKRHLLYVVVGGVLMVFAMKLDYRLIRFYVRPMMVSAFLMLILVLIPHVGFQTGGARRWFKILGLSFQPSEFAKMAMVFYLADFLARRQEFLGDIKHTLVPALFVLGLTVGPVLVQPDLGTAVVIGLVAVTMLFVAGVRLKHLGYFLMVAVPLMVAAMLIAPYRRRRLLAFINPWHDPRGASFQIIQSFLAFGSGGIFGVGLGHSQQKFFYLPASHTDFIFSIIGEELGFLGASAIILLFLSFIFAGFVIAFKMMNPFSQLLAVGLVSMIGIQAFINIGVTTGALPTKGLSLPFISYGGSSLGLNMAVVGLLLNLAKQRTRLIARQTV